MLHRYAEATRMAEGVSERALKALAASLSQPCHVAVNPGARRRSGVIELILGGEGPIEGAQILDERVGLAADLVLTADEVRGVLSQIGERDQMGEGAFVVGVEVEEDEEAINLAVRVRPERSPELRIAEIKTDLLARLALRPDARVKVRLDQASSRRVLARIEDVPGFGWKAWQPGALADPVMVTREADGGLGLANSLVSVAVSPHDGTFCLDGLAGFNRLVDSGDFGDTYNYSPPERDLVVDAPSAVSVSLAEAGPVRAVAVVERTYRWPERIDEARPRPGGRARGHRALPGRASRRGTARPRHDELRQHLPRPPAPGLLPSCRAGRRFASRVRLRRRRPRPFRRGRSQ